MIRLFTNRCTSLTSLFLIVLATSPFLSVTHSLGVYFSNETCILKYFEGNFTTVVCQENGSLVGLDVDETAGLMFWSNNAIGQKGIYSATLNTSLVRNIYNDTLMVKGLVVDRAGRLLYWTDESLRYIQSCTYDGTNMRIVQYTNLGLPRGLAVDHYVGWLFWNDQKSHVIEMSRLDGTGRRKLIAALRPNQMAITWVNSTARKLFFVDSSDQSLKSLLLLSLNGSSNDVIVQQFATELNLSGSLLPDDRLFGLAVQGGTCYITTWGKCRLIEVNLTSGEFTVVNGTKLGTSKLFSVASFGGDRVQNSTFDSESSAPNGTLEFTPNKNTTHNSTHNSTNDSTSNGNSSNADSSNQTSSFSSPLPLPPSNTSTQTFTTNSPTGNVSLSPGDTQNSSSINGSADKNSTDAPAPSGNSTSPRTSNETSPVQDGNSTSNYNWNSLSNSNETQSSSPRNTSSNHSTAATPATNPNNSNSSHSNDSASTSNTVDNKAASPSSPTASRPILPCAWSNKTCSHICIPMGPELGFKCACPTYGGLRLGDDKCNCTASSVAFVYTDQMRGHVGWLDAERELSESSFGLHLIARSSSPMAVTYDPLEKVVYWSDTWEGRIYRRPFDASSQAVEFLGMLDNVGIVEGLALDHVRRKLYFSSTVGSTIDGTEYTKNKVEVVPLSGKSRRFVVARDAERPRGLWVDIEAKRLYYTDIGKNARVVRSNLDGSNSSAILSREWNRISSPNSVLVSPTGRIFVLDSSYDELGTNSNASSLWHADRKLPVLSTGGYNWSRTVAEDLETPFGMAASPDGRFIFISEFNATCLRRYDTINESFTSFLNLSGTATFAGIALVQMNSSVSEDTSCNVNYNCSLSTNGGMCLSSGISDRCLCPSYGSKIFDPASNSCTVPESFILVADMMSLRMVGYNTSDKSVYDFISGNRGNSFSALTHDKTSGTFFYSDVNLRTIMTTKMSESPNATFFYNTSGVIDDMVVYNGSIYWLDSRQGQISRLNLGGASTNHTASPVVLLSGLKSPKSLAIHEHKGHLYWTSDCFSNVWKWDLSSGNESQIMKLNVSSFFTAGSLFIDQEKEQLYLMDRHTGAVCVCNLTAPENCTNLVNLTGGANFYGIQVLDDVIYYSNWGNKSIHALDLSNLKLELVAGRLTRPTRFLIRRDSRTNNPETPFPYFLHCPGDMHVFTTSTHENVWWKPPTSAGIPYPGKKANETLQPGALLTVGIHTPAYTVVGADGSKAKCEFSIIIRKIEGSSCSRSYSAINGDLSCDEGTSPVCSVKCRSGFIPLFREPPTGSPFQLCRGGAEQTDLFFCAENFSKVATNNLNMEFSGGCPSDPEVFVARLFYAFHGWKLCSPPTEVYQAGEDLCSRNNFRGVKCSPSRRKRQTYPSGGTFSAEMMLWEKEGSKNNVKRLESLIQSGSFAVSYSEFLQMKAVKLTQNVTGAPACPNGSFETVDGSCVVCPYGTFFHEANRTCTTCPVNTYQPDSGQLTCRDCPSTLSAPPGSFDSNQCTTAKDAQPSSSASSVSLIVGLVVALILGLLLVFALVLVARWHKKKKEQDMFEMEMRRRLETQGSRFGDYSDDQQDDPFGITERKGQRCGRRNQGFELTSPA